SAGRISIRLSFLGGGYQRIADAVSATDQPTTAATMTTATTAATVGRSRRAQRWCGHGGVIAYPPPARRAAPLRWFRPTHRGPVRWPAPSTGTRRSRGSAG